MIAANTENTTWEKLIQRELFDVLGMKSASFGPPGTKDKTGQPWGHIPVGENLVAQQGDNPPTLGPAGTVHLNLIDWAKFALAHAGCSDPKIVSDETMKVLHEIVKQDDRDQNNYACGWMVLQRPWARGTALTHSGSNTMWYATVWVAPNNDSVYMAAINAGINEGILKATDQAIGELIGIHRAAYEKELKEQNKK
jgi:CubicO group peptidase (beta-lactamase class C family)